jgi:hypothetical protein
LLEEGLLPSESTFSRLPLLTFSIFKNEILALFLEVVPVPGLVATTKIDKISALGRVVELAMII